MRATAKSKVDYDKLHPGLYVSRHSHSITTFDLRFVRPNHDVFIPQPALHTIEHLGNDFLKNNKKWGDSVEYFGPMSSRTGFYMLVAGWHTVSSKESPVCLLVKKMLNYIVNFEGDIPGATKKECGNYKEHDLLGAKEWAKKYLLALEKKPHFEYPTIE